MPGLPVAQVLCVDREAGLVRYDVLCPYCNAVHHHQWFGTKAAFVMTASCSTGSDARRYSVRVEGRDDNAMHEYENNWIE